MRAAVARNRAIVVDDIDDPTPGPGDALVRVIACGICGSDLHALVHADLLVEAAAEVGVPLQFDPRLDYVMGHEFSAEVVELGPATDGVPVAPGDLVTSLPVALTATGMEAGRRVQQRLQRWVRGAHAADRGDLSQDPQRPRRVAPRSPSRWPSVGTRSRVGE